MENWESDHNHEYESVLHYEIFTDSEPNYKVTLEEQSKEETSSKSQNKETGVHPNLTTDLKIPTTVTTQESSSDNEHTTNQSFILAGNTDVLFGSPESVVASDNFIQDNPFIEPLKEANQPTRSFSYLERILASQATRNSSAVTQIVNDKLLANASLPDKFKSSNHGDTKVSFISPEKGLESTQRSPSVSTAINDEIPMEELAVLSNNEEESQSGSPSVFVPQEDDISDHSEMIQINSPTFSPTQPESFEDDIPVEGDNHSAGFPGDSSDDHDMFGYTPLDQVHKFDNDILPRIDDTSIIDKPYLVSRVSGKTNSENSNGLDSDYGLSRKTIKSLLGSLTLENNKKRKRLKSTSEALGLVQQQSETFLTNLTSDLEVYARHRGGTEITIRDVMLFIRRLKYPTVNGARANNVNYFSELAGKHLPLESLMELNNCLKNTYYTNMVEVDDQDLDDSDINEDPSIENFTDDSS
ncbi:hypothetical protein CANTEDRAFT_136915 [Yamadazyma tenuis ATCC 10573]|uniref:CENP-T/Histone H4 histone fold domain-containing protein n=1 Tax=Candida tenuis (strain ATCC 10573 / BCRC 21748 / CBS 615 / JCM 9827 / NBRC 10315 / NRRL Y-1498 / VKM Y-70) TaxID=590646 RepID=G3BE10_CANTC|nr:uncharacterized protein CANTEDRAFT_136915 [Yamadazyma tenuis ATCC 10573]EGV60430.1 hypothetical protein CANTEDRAFT_136915 [Yamadazyma tenuis ATCC 10573]